MHTKKNHIHLIIHMRKTTSTIWRSWYYCAGLTVHSDIHDIHYCFSRVFESQCCRFFLFWGVGEGKCVKEEDENMCIWRCVCLGSASVLKEESGANTAVQCPEIFTLYIFDYNHDYFTGDALPVWSFIQPSNKLNNCLLLEWTPSSYRLTAHIPRKSNPKGTQNDQLMAYVQNVVSDRLEHIIFTQVISLSDFLLRHVVWR